MTYQPVGIGFVAINESPAAIKIAPVGVGLRGVFRRGSDKAGTVPPK